VKVALDTSVIVAATLADHVHHERAAWWLAERSHVQLSASWHALAETWATLTRLPIAPPINGATAQRIVKQLEGRLHLWSPTPQAYREAMRRCAERGLRSGVICDALHLVAARNGGADSLITFDAADFERVREDGDPEIVVPPDPPGPAHLGKRAGAGR
jgi:predicted nucleic acid-binding protein